MYTSIILIQVVNLTEFRLHLRLHDLSWKQIYMHCFYNAFGSKQFIHKAMSGCKYRKRIKHLNLLWNNF